jgi:hypothetical protein
MFEHHAFISYALIDNKPLSPEQQGWVTLRLMPAPGPRSTLSSCMTKASSWYWGPKAGAGSAHAEPPRSPMLKAATAIDEDMTLKAASCHLVQPARQDIESQRADFQMALRNRQAT